MLHAVQTNREVLVQRAALHRETVDGDLLRTHKSANEVAVVFRKVHGLNNIQIGAHTDVPSDERPT